MSGGQVAIRALFLWAKTASRLRTPLRMTTGIYIHSGTVKAGVISVGEPFLPRSIGAQACYYAQSY
jgi:hypothetical protein